jgi:uncharacterized protein YecT (DUF1311 family)
MISSRSPYRRLLILLLGVIFAGLTPAHASQAGKEANEADAALNVAYKALLAGVHDPAERTALVAAQKAWIALRDNDVALFAARYPASKGGLFYNIHLMRERTAFLKALLASPASTNDQGPDAYVE